MQITTTQWNSILNNAKNIVHTEAPYKAGRPLKHLPSKSTGNLKNNALKLEQLSSHEWVIFIDTNIAYYMPYTEYKWISPKWNGAKNPNENWFKNSANIVYESIRKQLTKIASKQVAKWVTVNNLACEEEDEDD